MCIFVILSSFEAYCQEVKYTISGTINSSQGEPLVGVTVKVGNGSSGTVTDIDGKYSLKVAKGRHKLTVSCIGYKEKIQILFVESNCTINFSLEEDVVMMNNVVVVGESKNTKVKSGVFSANAIDVSSKLSSIQTIANEVEKGIGVRIRRSGGIGSDYNLTLNGMGGNSIRYYVDGIPMAAKGESFSLENIPASIVGDALGGAINIVTNESKKNYYDISYRVGSFNTHQVDFNAQIIEPKTGLTFKPSVGYNFSKNNYTMKGVRVLNPEKNEFETGDFKRFHDDYRSVFAQFETGFTNKLWADFLYVTASFTNVDKDIQTGATQDVVYGAAHRKNRSWNLGIRYRKKNFLAEGLTLSEIYDRGYGNGNLFLEWSSSPSRLCGAKQLSSYSIL